MFVGHLALSFAARRTDRATSLVWYVVAANLIDLLWPILLLLGVERVRVEAGNTAFTPLAFDHYPWTHSLLMVVVWAVALGALARWRGVPARVSWIVAALVLSHWVLDAITHAPDLPLWPGSEALVGFRLWDSIPGTFVVETALWVAGLSLFLGARRPRDAAGQLALWSFVAVCTLMWAASPFTPLPPDDRSVAIFSMVGWIVVPWAWWIERTTDPRGG